MLWLPASYSCLNSKINNLAEVKVLDTAYHLCILCQKSTVFLTKIPQKRRLIIATQSIKKIALYSDEHR